MVRFIVPPSHSSANLIARFSNLSDPLSYLFSILREKGRNIFNHIRLRGNPHAVIA